MVVRLVLEHHQPFFRWLSIDRNGHHDRSGIYLFGNFDIVEFTGFPQLAHPDEGDVHQGDRLIVPTELLAGGEVSLPSALDTVGIFAESNIVDFREEGGVAAVVGPVGVEHPDFRQAWVALFLVAEIVLTEGHVLGRHGEPEVLTKRMRVEQGKAGKDRDVGGFVGVRL